MMEIEMASSRTGNGLIALAGPGWDYGFGSPLPKKNQAIDDLIHLRGLRVSTPW